MFHQLFYDKWVAGLLIEPLARIGMIEWKAARGGVAVSPQAHGSTTHRHLSHVEQEMLPPMPKIRGAELMDSWSAAWLWGWWWLKDGDAWLLSKRQAASHGLSLMIPQMFSACKQNTQSDCKKQPTSSWVARRKFTGADDPRYALQKMEAWRTCGTWAMVTSCITRSWCRLACRNLTTPVRKLERSGTHRKRKSSTT